MQEEYYSPENAHEEEARQHEHKLAEIRSETDHKLAETRLIKEQVLLAAKNFERELKTLKAKPVRDAAEDKRIKALRIIIKKLRGVDESPPSVALSTIEGSRAADGGGKKSRRKRTKRRRTKRGKKSRRRLRKRTTIKGGKRKRRRTRRRR